MSVAARYQRFWLELGVSRARLAWLRVVFFTLIGVDAFLQIEHAPRYGAGGFNVAHVAWLDALLPAPSRPLVLGLFLAQAYLAFRVACGAAVRVSVAVLTALYGYTYFISQLDSYQHHYLVFLVLLLFCFVPWDGPQGTGAPPKKATPGAAADVTSPALRLVFVQLALLYAWAAVAKLDPAWLDGTTLDAQLRPSLMRDVAEVIGVPAMAKLVVLTELFLAVVWLWPRLWAPGLVVGLMLHGGIELASGGSFDIGIFSYFMAALYLLLVPDRVLRAGHGRIERAAAWVTARAGMLWTTAGRAHGVSAAFLVAGLGCTLTLPFDEAALITAAIAALAAVAFVPWPPSRPSAGREPAVRRRDQVRVALAHAVACAAILALHAGTEQAHNYYKYWAGSSRRLARWDDARQAYTMLTRLSPAYGPGHYHLAGIARRDGRVDDALAGYRRAQLVSPADHRAFLQEAELHHAAGRGPETVRAADRVIALAPRSQRDLARARALRAAWTGARPSGAAAPAQGPGADDDAEP